MSGYLKNGAFDLWNTSYISPWMPERCHENAKRMPASQLGTGTSGIPVRSLTWSHLIVCFYNTTATRRCSCWGSGSHYGQRYRDINGVVAIWWNKMLLWNIISFVSEDTIELNRRVLRQFYHYAAISYSNFIYF